MCDERKSHGQEIRLHERESLNNGGGGLSGERFASFRREGEGSF